MGFCPSMTPPCPLDDYDGVVIACGEGCDRSVGYSKWLRRPKGRKMASKKTEPATTKEVREWAQAKGLPVAARGRIKPEVFEQFVKATKRTLA